MMISLIRNEMHKIFAGRKLYMFMLLGLAFSVVVFVALNALSGQFADSDESMPIPTAHNFPVINLELMVGIIIPLFIFVVVADQMTEEYKQGTQKVPLLYGASRSRLLHAKMSALAVSVSILLGFTLLSSYLIGLIAGGWEGQFVFGSLTLTSTKGVFLTIGAYLVSVIPLISVGGWVILLSLYVSSTGALIGIPLGLGLVSKLIGDLYPSIAPYLLTTQVLWYTKLLEYVGDGFIWQDLMPALGIMASNLIIPMLLSLWVFRRKDLLT